jgi:MoaA/NifB/PqqE/SkfB family radical SAM enzyme
MNFDQSPMLVIWEATQACDLACVHCRASAQPDRDDAELSTGEAYRLLDQIHEFGNPLVVLTGGDPLKRPDLFNIIERSVGLGFRTTVTPSATPLLTHAAVARFKECGVSRMAVSLDGPGKAIHDGFRGVPGTFDRAMFALRYARERRLFDGDFRLETPGRLYCSELVWRAFREAGIDLVEGRFSRLELPLRRGDFILPSAFTTSPHLGLVLRKDNES